MTKEETKKKYTKRLNIIEGQVKGIKQMIEDNREVSDILIQIAAINKSIKSLGNEMLKNYMTDNAIKEIKKGNEEKIDEMIKLFERVNG
jgi:DNA-binding FrmR family transcriptional regulator